jgi:hypothetical protein
MIEKSMDKGFNFSTDTIYEKCTGNIMRYGGLG